jgi:indolepyruvate ferredoxin oxidoreductase
MTAPPSSNSCGVLCNAATDLSARPAATAPDDVTLDDKWVLTRGRVVMNGAQAIARVLLAQRARDRQNALDTKGYVTGYRGSPLGNVDTTFWSIQQRLAQADILFQPALNEDIAATALRGTQQLDALPGPRCDGVFAAWYGKGPGVDRSCDAFKHGNYAGSHAKGGVVIFYGDDHGGKSSTVAHQSEQAAAASLIPSLYPADVGEILEYGLLAFAMSRYSGSWVAVKCVDEVAEQTATVDLHLDGPVAEPASPGTPPEGVHIRQGPFDPLREEQIVVEHRLPRVHAFVRSNGIDRCVIRAERPALGLVTAGKSYGDVRAALALLGLDDERAAATGISLYKVGCIWPLEPTGLAAFAAGNRTLLVVEEKKGLLEPQAAAALINRADRPVLIGKTDEAGSPLLSSVLPLEPSLIALAIADRLELLGLLDDALRAARDRLLLPHAGSEPTVPRRAPYFCSGCPHNRSTVVPDGSVSMTGIGCHTMANFVRPDVALLPTQMGGEGGNWIGLAPFTDTPHIFQNMGDGTYYHSGTLAIRAAVAAGVNITYKILYNDAVAMTGGQPVDGPISVAAIAHQVKHEGVKRVVLLSDDPDRHRRANLLPSDVTIGHRDELDVVQRTLRETPGCTVLIYDQTCAAKMRRQRKRGTFAEAPKRLFIAREVCEGCGDCSVQSTCVSLVPIETALGRKRAIDQSSCNKDYSCLNGFCPAFLTVRGAALRKPEIAAGDDTRFEQLPPPERACIGRSGFNLMISGIGGTGVITVGALVGMAAHLDGLAMSSFDMTGLSQKNGAVYSHVRIARAAKDITSQRLGRGDADLLLAFDLIAALGAESGNTILRGRTRVLVNGNLSPTVALQFDRDFSPDRDALLSRLRDKAGQDAVETVDASSLALALLGDTIGTNLFLIGIAVQRGLLPVSVQAIERSISLNGVAVSFNLEAFRLGRLFAVDPARMVALATSRQRAAPPLPKTLADEMSFHIVHLTDYQNAALAERYRALVERVAAREASVIPGSDTLARAVARNYGKLLAYKDEYEVARLLTQPALEAELAGTFAPGGRVAFNLAPPILAGRLANGRPRKREFAGWLRPLLGLLAHGRHLRGTIFDPLGYTTERRTERALIGEYEHLVGRVLTALSPATHAAGVRLLSLADDVRGFGPVKAAAIERYRERSAAAERDFLSLSVSPGIHGVSAGPPFPDPRCRS